MAIRISFGSDQYSDDRIESNKKPSAESQKLEDAKVLLMECLGCFNALPNKKYEGNRDTYSLATEITNFLNDE